tara:strand:+ start:284 stop:1219 length:936 start_codon:yes stop_codon:yes gene_type:complete
VSKKNCWILSDNLVGHEKQSISLAEKLNINYKLIKIKKVNFIKRNLSNFFNLQKKNFFKQPYPKIIISCGKNTAYYSKMIKQKTKNKIFSIFIQKPPININNFDVVISPKHDKCKGLNVIETQGALTKINLKYIKNVNKTKKPSILKQNFITVLIGGNSRHHKITKPILDKIIKNLKSIEEQKKIRIFILVSRRTGKKDYLYLKKNLISKNFIFVLPNSKKVSYLNALSFAKAIIVTSDSVSMVTEACSTGKPTYIIDIPTKSKRFSLFIKNLIHLKLAYYLKDSISLKGKKKALNDIDKVVEKIKKRIEI